MRITAVIAVEGENTGDGRMIEPGALVWDDGPWPLKWNRDGGDHDGRIVGEISTIRRDGALIRAEGAVSVDSADEETRVDAARVAELFEAGVVGLSVGLDDEYAEIRVRADALSFTETDNDDGTTTVARWEPDDELYVVTHARIREISVVDVAAFADTAAIVAVGEVDWAYTNPEYGPPESDLRLVEQHAERGEEPRVFYGAPITVEDGVVRGHAMLWDRCHGGYQSCVPGRLLRNMRLGRFLSGQAAPGVRTGPLTVATTHANLMGGHGEAMDHYANTGRAVADVACGFDEFGLWVSGRVRPGVSEADLAALVGSTPSVDARPIGGEYSLAGILMVNNPGFLVERGIAAAIGYGADCDCGPDPIAVLTARVDALEVEAARQIVASVQ